MLMVAKLSENATIPTRSSKLAAGYDLYSAEDKFVPAWKNALVWTDLQIKVPHGTYGRIAARSGLSWKYNIDIGAGVIDEDYRENVGVVMFNHSNDDFEVKKGTRIAQLICEKISYPKIKKLNTLYKDKIDREGGFGSSGIF